jgi:AcrR family transcriptional regulator
MPVTARKSIGAQRNPESEKAILKAAADLLEQEGLGKFSIEAVARRARAGKPTIYRWWPDKTALLLAVYAGLKDELLLPDTGSLEGDIVAFLDNLFAFWRGRAGAIFRSVLAESQTDEAARAALTSYHATRRQHLAAMFGRSHGGRTPTQEQAELIAELVVAYAFSQLLMGSIGENKAEWRRLAQLVASGN